jgi:photosystem II stability/assembly factor-like uncharacterized protein
MKRLAAALLAPLLIPGLVFATGAAAKSSRGSNAATTATPGYLNDISCPGTSHCLAVGGYGLNFNVGVILVTTNGGLNWAPASLPSPLGDLSGISCPSTSICFVVGQNSKATVGVILSTTNGGASWKLQTAPTGLSIVSDVSCPSTSHCWATGSLPPAIIGTANGGATWASEKLPTQAYDYGISCPSTSNCWAANGDGDLVTTNGGTTWKLQGSGGPLSGISCPDISHCWAIDANNILVATTNGGISWKRQYVPGNTKGPINLEGISCLDVSHCWTVGYGDYGAVVFVTADGGTRWALQKLPSGLAALGNVGVNYGGGITCRNLSDCWAVGVTELRTPAIIATTNGGTTWKAQKP